MVIPRFDLLDDRLDRVPVTRVAPLILPWHGRVWLSMPTTRRLFIYVTIIFVLVLAAPVVDLARNGSIRDAWMTLMISAIPGSLCAMVIFVLLQSQDRPYRARQIARRHRCPACAYALAGLVAAEDGCTVCPECGSAWDMETAHTAQSTSRSDLQAIVDDRGRKHVMPRWVPKSSWDLWRQPSTWRADAPLLGYMILNVSVLA